MEKTKDKCVWKNMCSTPHLCCRFCKSKTCDVRCTDELQVCKFLTDEERKATIIPVFQKEETDKPKRGRKKKTEIISKEEVNKILDAKSKKMRTKKK